MSQRQRQILWALLCAVTATQGLAALPVQAKPEYQEVFQRAYPAAEDTPLGKASCQTCHVAAGPPKRNTYGKEVEKALDAAGTKTLTVEILRQAEMVDSDGDGAANQEELKAGSLPSEASSLPQQTAVSSPTAASTTVPPSAPETTAASASVTPKAKAPGMKGRRSSAASNPARTAKLAPTAQTKTKQTPALVTKPPAAAVVAGSEAKPARPVASEQAPARPPVPSARVPAPGAVTVAPTPSAQQEAPPVKEPAPAAAEPSITAAPTSNLIAELFNRIVPPHSFHPVIVHFPIALFLFGGICELWGAWKQRPMLRTAGALNMTAASITALGAVATGFLALWRTGFPLAGMALVHLLLAVAATASMAATALIGWSFIHLHKERTSRIYWFLLGVSLLLISLAGHFGGELVYSS